MCKMRTYMRLYVCVCVSVCLRVCVFEYNMLNNFNFLKTIKVYFCLWILLPLLFLTKAFWIKDPLQHNVVLQCVCVRAYKGKRLDLGTYGRSYHNNKASALLHLQSTAGCLILYFFSRSQAK